MESKQSEVGPCGDFLRGGFIERLSSRVWLDPPGKELMEIQEIVFKITLKRKQTPNKKD